MGTWKKGDIQEGQGERGQSTAPTALRWVSRSMISDAITTIQRSEFLSFTLHER